MELSEYGSFADKCFRDTPPPCAAMCPLAYDVRDFIRLMRKGSYRNAYKMVRAALVFPSIITEICPEPCRNSCVRGRLTDEESIDLKQLEKICVDKMSGKKPERYNIPPRKETAAVIGAGLSGLACAFRLTEYGYGVTVYEKTDRLGGALPSQIDPGWAHDELEREFSASKCTFVMGTAVRSLDAIEADAVYVATGEGGETFDRDDRECIIRGGALIGTDIMGSVRMGLSAAEAMDRWFKVNMAPGKAQTVLTLPEGEPDARYYDLDYDLSVPEGEPEKGAAEAYRCMRCNCSACYDVCPLMEKHKFFPRKVCTEVITTLKPNVSRRSNVRMVMSCTECGLCREACPEGIDMGKCLQNARTDFYESGAMSPAFHDYWLQDMEFCESSEARLLKVKDESRPADVLYFPGCQLSASMPELTIESYKAIERACENPAVLLACCGVPAKWAGHTAEFEEVRSQIIYDWESIGKPLVVTACPSCLHSMKELHPDMKVISYYVFASEHPEIIAAENNHVAALRTKVIDPCSSIAEPEMADAIRILLKKAGCDIINEEADPACCGFGGHIYNAVPALHDTFAARRIEDIKDSDTLAACCCANCRDILAYRGADARHVLGMILGMEEDRRRPPELGERRSNRRIVRRWMESDGALSAADIREEIRAESGGMKILIPEKLIDKMDRELILRDQVAEIISEAEASDAKVYDEDDNIFIAHKRFGAVTVWAAYSYAPVGAVTLENVYLHRMEIREDQR